MWKCVVQTVSSEIEHWLEVRKAFWIRRTYSQYSIPPDGRKIEFHRFKWFGANLVGAAETLQ